MIATTDKATAADVASLIVERTLVAEQIAQLILQRDRATQEIERLTQKAGRIEDEMERHSLFVERMTEPGDIKVRIAT